jgi:predicted MFS family arabinose efflux permease
MFIAGVMENMTGIVQVSYRLGVIPDALQGRVNSSYRLFSYFGVTLGTAAGGILLDRYGARPVLTILAGSIALIGAGTALSPLRRL